LQADVTLEAEVQSMMRHCHDECSRLDVLVNSAGTGGSRTLLRDMAIEDWDRTIAANLRSVALCVKHAIPLLETTGGRIVNVGSRDGLSGTRASRSDYVASKFALTGLTEALAQELGPLGICINDVCPGAVRTDLFMESAAKEAQKSGLETEAYIRARFSDAAALRRMVAPDDVANAVAFLASKAAAGITGIHLKVDCGRPV
jgi:NAD(P)-dependent dehydrogenase (short-subunit alcohol dehydrogenase family)